MKKMLALVLALVMLCTCFAACGDGSSGSTASAGNTSSAAADDTSSAAADDASSAAGDDASSEASTASGEKIKVGILAPAVTHGWVAGVAFFAEARCKELSDTVEYKLLTSSNAEEMTNQIDELRTWGAQAVVAYPQWEGMEDPIQQLIDDGISVVNFDIIIEADGIYRVSGDNEDMGTQSAQYIVDKIGTTGKVVMLEVPSSGSVSELRKKGFEEKMAEIAPDMEILPYATQFTREDGLKDFADILQANPQIDAVFSMDDETSIGVLQAIEEANRTDIKVVTGGGGMQEYFNMMPENEEIWIQSALYSPSMIEDAVDMAVSLVKGEKVDEVKIIPTTVVDRENYKDYLADGAPY